MSHVPWHLRQSVETPDERNERRCELVRQRLIETLYALIADLSPLLAKDGRADDWVSGETYDLRQRVANALPSAHCPNWLTKYRDPSVVASGEARETADER